MKRICTSFLIICMLFTLLPCCNAAASYLAITNVDVSYANRQITVECQSNALYRQRVIAVIYDSQQSSPDWNNYARAVEGITDTNGKCSLAIKLGNDMENVGYTIAIRGNGTKSADSYDKTNFEIIPLNEADSVLNRFNSANEGSLKDLYNTYKVAFKIDAAMEKSLYTNNPTDYLGVVCSLRSEDYANGRFDSLDNVRDAFKTAGELIKLSNCSNADAAGENLFENAKIYGIDTQDGDYVSVKDTADALFLGLNRENRAKSTSGVRAKFKEALSVAMINTVDVSSLDAVVKKYKNELGIASMIDLYNQLNTSQRSTVVRCLTDKNFKNAQSVCDAFDEAISLVTKNPTIIPKDDGSGSGGGGGGGISSDIKPVAGDTKPVIDITTKLFDDLQQYEWAQESIEVLYKRGVINGYGDGTFKGNNSVIRSEFVKMVVTAFGIYDAGAQCEFLDVDKENWAHSFIGSAVNNKIVFGREDGSFGCSDAVTREDAAVIIYRAAKAINLTLVGENIINFTDASELSDYSADAVRILSRAAVINGFEDGSFAPKATLTRAQSAKIVYEILKRI